MNLDRTQCPEIHSLHQMDIQQPERVVLPNGTPLVVLEGGVSDVFRLDVLVYGGQWRQEMPLQSSFTSNMLCEGTRQLSSSQISDLLDRYGAWIQQNAGVDHSVITLYSLNKYARETLDVVTQMLLEPTFPQHEFEVLVANKRQLFQVNEKKVANLAHKAFSKAVLGEYHPCSRFAQLADYEQIQTHHLQQFYRKHYHSGNVVLFLSGKVNEGVRQLVEEYLGKRAWGESQEIAPISPVALHPISDKRLFIQQPDSQQSGVRMGLLTIPVNDPDFDDLSILNTVLGGYFGSRLMMNIREEKGYTYGIGSGILPMPFQSQWIMVSECAHEYVEPLITEVHNEMAHLREERIGDEELEMVQNYMLGEFCRLVDHVLTLPDVYIYALNCGLPDDYVQHRIASVQQISSDRLQQLAQKYLVPAHIKEVVAGKCI